ncbi:MAG: NUDIX domain-containing protein [Candidatus Nomurabacteria bacterium]|nr:NUDIX domain-containing protein [Candidatus Nomurabacteria bacterium]
MEYLDICDSEGNLLGIKKTKKEAHDKGLWHRAVHVWIINSKKEVLIQKRSHLVENHPNLWDISAAGHVSAGEDYITSVLRETEEEIGLKLKPEDFIRIGIVKNISARRGYINNEVDPVYIVKMDLEVNKIKKQEEEVSEIKFISYKKLEQIIKSNDPTFVQHPEEYKLLFDYISKN